MIEWFGETERQIAEAEPIICDSEKLRELSSDHKVISTYLSYILCQLLQLQNRTHNYTHVETSVSYGTVSPAGRPSAAVNVERDQTTYPVGTADSILLA